MTKTKWETITPSQFLWEQAALDFVRSEFPDHEPYRAWSNFEFITFDGAIYEVDLLVLTKQGFWLVEIKSRPGRVEGDAGTWTWVNKEGRRLSVDNPVLLANRKAKALSSLLKPKMTAQKIPLPWLEALVFLSDPEIQCDLQGTARNRVALVDREPAEGRPGRPGIRAALINREVPGVEPVNRAVIDIKTAKALTRALAEVGIRPSQKARRVGEYTLKQLLDEGPGIYQDRVAEHSALPGVFRRVRQYLVSQAATEEDRQRMRRAATREFRILQSFDHPGILDALDYKEHEYGPALLFNYEPGAMRLDHYLTNRGAKLTPGTRLELVRQVADAVRYAHSKKVVHRALAPQSVLVMDPDAPTPRLKVFNWHVGVREAEPASSATIHVRELVDRLATAYMAPEALQNPKAASEASDVFSLGAIAYHVFSGRPPGDGATEVARLLDEHHGLKVSAVLDGAGLRLEELIHRSTDPDVDFRIESAVDFLKGLDDVEDELTAPDDHGTADPAAARQGDRIEGGFTVDRFLGQGATGVALLARRGDDEVVLKVARTPDDDDRLRQEAEALGKVRSEFIVGLREVREIRGRAVLVLDKSGDETLAERLRKEGRLSLDLLQRFGEDLLQAVASLERHGVAHRDIKPDNIGVRSGKQRLQLVLFDFSLARVPADQIQVGTHPYLDPFLSKRQPARWDTSAERYAAGVTLYEMAAGVLPRWGDGRSDPALTDAVLTIEAERFDAAVRDDLAEFCRLAMAREPKGRFDNAEEMLRAWREVFERAERRSVTTPSGEEVPISGGLDRADADSLVATLGLSTRAANALDRAGVTVVRQLLGLPINEVRFMRGVGKKTRDELVASIDTLRRQLPDAAKEAREVRKVVALDDPATPPDLDALRTRLIDVTARTKDATTVRDVRVAYLGLDNHAEAGDGRDWPDGNQVGARMGLTRQRMSQILEDERGKWLRLGDVGSLRTDLVDLVRAAGGVMTLTELADALVALRGSGLAATDKRTRLATALIRIAFEADQTRAKPELVLKRSNAGLLLANSTELAEYAERLGVVADELAAEYPLPATPRVFQRLVEVPAPEYPADVPPPGNDRLLRLAAAASRRAAVSTRQELYPRGLDPERALRLGLGAISGLDASESRAGEGERFDPKSIRERIAARYPAAGPLPDRPQLDQLLRDAGLNVVWDDDAEVYRRLEDRGEITAGSTQPRRRTTHQGSRPPARVIDPIVAEARQFEERLRYALRDGSFLALIVPPKEMLAAETQLQVIFPTLDRRSLDRLILGALRAKADEDGVDWQVVREADGAPAGSEDHRHLCDMVAEVMPGIERAILGQDRPILLVHPGLLARYDQVDLLARLRDRVGRPGVCPGLWVLIAADMQSDLPLIDGVEVPLIGSGQRAQVPRAWIENRHRAGGSAPLAPLD